MNKTKIPSREELQQSYNELKTYRAIAEKYGCGLGTVHNWFKHYGIEAIPKKGRKLTAESRGKVIKTLVHGAMRGKAHSEETKREMSENRKGENNPNYKGGKTSFIRSARGTKEYAHWRKVILSRANGKCEMCGRELPLEAHHINSIHKDISRIYDLNNGKALCEDCHLIADGKEKKAHA